MTKKVVEEKKGPEEGKTGGSKWGKVGKRGTLALILGLGTGTILGGEKYLQAEDQGKPKKERTDETNSDHEVQESYDRMMGEVKGHQEKGIELLENLQKNGNLSQELKEKIINTIETGNEKEIEELLREVSMEEMMGAKGILIALAVLLLAAIIRTALSGKPFGFRLHACAAALYSAMAFIEPDTILHETGMSAFMMAVVFFLARMARGVVNKEDLTKLTHDEAKHVVWLLAPLGNIMNGLATSRILSPAISQLSDDEHKYQAMQAGPNIMAGAGVGDMPFIVPQLKMPGRMPLLKGNAYTWQAKIMFPIMIWHRIYQANLWGINFSSLKKHRSTIWKVISNTRYRRDRVFGFGEESQKEMGLQDDLRVQGAGPEEHHVIQEFLIHLGQELQEAGASDEEIKQITQGLEENIENIPFGGKPHGDGFEEEEDEKKEDGREKEIPSTEDTKEVITSINGLLEDPETKDDMNVIAKALADAIRDGKISKSQLESFEHKEEIRNIVLELPGVGGVLKKRERKLDKKFFKLLGFVKGDGVEAEVARVLPLQTMLVPLIAPLIIAATQYFPFLIDPITAAGTTVLDNMVQATMSRSVDNAKAIAYSIIFGAFFTISNMANILALGKHASFKKSLQQAKRIIPTGLFALGYLNSDIIHTLIDKKDISHMTQTVSGQENNPEQMSNMSKTQRDSLKTQGLMIEYPADTTQE